MTILHARQAEYVLNEGNFQLSVHRMGLQKNQPLTGRSLDASPRRMCTSVLVRLVRAPRSADGLQVRATSRAHIFMCLGDMPHGFLVLRGVEFLCTVGVCAHLCAEIWDIICPHIICIKSLVSLLHHVHIFSHVQP
jgi:hypothetical protein